ncbi:MAG: hypothetical protein H5T91_07995 [Synergistetes bacterium]|nr:MAG: hypothetical protein XD52_1230 [bacterium 42_11]MBC7332345.1 hypothetical protein [Synergistota bacterium]MDK2870982.1 hypothetical protein [bacterium]
MEFYRRSQLGFGIICLLSIGIFAAFYGFAIDRSIGTLLIGFLLCAILLLFYKLTVIIDSEKLEISFGLGLIRKRFYLKDILSFRVVKNPWWYGWGIKTIPGGWSFSVSGFKAIELKMRNGKVYRVGSDSPEEISAFLSRKMDLRGTG